MNNQIMRSTWDDPACTTNRRDNYINQNQCDSSTKTNDWFTVSSPFFSRDMFVVYADQTSCANNANTTITARRLNRCIPTGNGKSAQYSCGGSVVQANEYDSPDCTGAFGTTSWNLGCQGNTTYSAPSCAGPAPSPPPEWTGLYYVEMDYNAPGCQTANFQNGRGAQVGVCSGNSISICNCTNYQTFQYADVACTIGTRSVTGSITAGACSTNGGSVQNWCGEQIPFDATPYVLQADWNGNNNNNQPGPSCKSGNWSYTVRPLNKCTGGGGHFEMVTCAAENAVVWTTCDGATDCSGNGCSNQTQPVGCFDGPQQNQFQIKVAPGCPAVREPLSASAAGFQTMSIYMPDVPCDQVIPANYSLRQSQRLGECNGGQATVFNGSAFIKQYYADYYCNYPFDYVQGPNNNCGDCQPQPTGCSYPSEMDGNTLNISMISGHATWAEMASVTDKFFYMQWMTPECQTSIGLVPDQVVNLPVGVCFDFIIAGFPFGFVNCTNDGANFTIVGCEDAACTTCEPFTMLGNIGTTGLCVPGGGGDNGDSGSQLFLCPGQVPAFASSLNASATRSAAPPSPPGPAPGISCPVATTAATTARATTASAATTAAAPTSTSGAAPTSSSTGSSNVSAASPLSFGWAVVAVALLASLL